MSATPARRSRRATTAAEASSTPAATAPGEESERPSRRRGGPSSRVVAFPEPTIQTSTYTPAPFTPAPLAAVPSSPPPPAEEPAQLLPSDRRSFGYGAAHGASGAHTPSSRHSSIDQLAIGEIDQTLFDCPQCRRPLALGARRCPGCGSLLVRGVLLRKAALFVAAGAVAGGLLGLGGGALIGGGLAAGAAGLPGSGAGSSDAPTDSPAAPPTHPATASPAAPSSPAATPAPTEPTATLPFAVRSAFVQLLGADARFAAAEAELRDALAAKVFDASAVATTLRGVSSQTVFAAQLAGQIAAWPGAGDLGPVVTGYYATLHDTAAAALDNSVRNTAAYRTAARAVADLLAGRAAIAQAIRAAAEAAGEPLPATAP